MGKTPTVNGEFHASITFQKWDSPHNMNQSVLLSRLDSLIKDRGESYKSVSLKAKLGETAVRDIVVGRIKNPGIYTLEKIARALDSSLLNLMEGGDGMPSAATLTDRIPLLGYVGAGGNIYTYDDLPLIPRVISDADRDTVNCEFVDAPPGHYPDGIIALRVTGTSQKPYMPPGTIVYYSNRFLGGAPQECIGKMCVVQTKDEATMLKKVEKSLSRGLFDLLSYNSEPISEVELAWCAPVIFIKPY